MMQCIVIEDQPPAQRVLKKYINDIGSLELKATFADALSAVDYLKTEKIDLIFLDIHLPKISGLEFLKVIKHEPNVILTTAFSEYALESYDFGVVDYLLKPFSFERFVQAVNKVQRLESDFKQERTLAEKNPLSNVIFIKSGYEHIKIEVGDICYIRSDSDYTEIHTKDQRHLSQETLRYWQVYLDPQKFSRIHKSYILNITKIYKINANQVILKNNETLPIGRAFKEEFMKLVIKE
ncbi:LytTR family two component transcriptional regulator [Maribacter caenipelagi]|uniref:LytTR family two component transcriptional regulator n=1 Tax=Maribacter caenipelagi TaxID=1447781 RepID=A0A4R7DIL5_9FLAO|nr:LytTR family DNA-binding domain-containing protein [Maribacter caenipelagi]TDS19136.1 LytTR family two component transcriptional regulator [Maribacter caenipelagi]